MKKLRLVERHGHTAFVRRIEDVVALAGKSGWGYQDQLRAEFEDWLVEPVPSTRKPKA